jgi:hypothetical protein
MVYTIIDRDCGVKVFATFKGVCDYLLRYINTNENELYLTGQDSAPLEDILEFKLKYNDIVNIFSIRFSEDDWVFRVQLHKDDEL